MSNSIILSGVKAFVAGATGEVGKGAAAALVQAGAEVWISGRSEAKLNQLKDSLQPNNKVHVVSADYSTSQGAMELESKLGNEQFDVVVASSGPWWPVNKLYEVKDFAIFEQALNSNLLAQLFLYRVLVSRTKQQYISVNGTAAYMLPNSTLTGICANSVIGFAKVAFAECSADTNLPQFTHAMISSSVGHAQFRKDTHDPVEFGRVFVAMALNQHQVDSTGTIVINDQMYEELVKKL